MKYKNINIWLLLLLCCSIGACKKELNVYPTTSEVDGNVIVDAKSAATVLNGVYYRFANSGLDPNSVPSTFWTDVKEDIPSELCGTVTDTYGDDFMAFTLNSKSYQVDLIWNYGYKLVNAANGFLKNIAPVNNIPAATKKQMQAEAMFLRAYGNEELLLYYGEYADPASKFGNILRDEPVSTNNIKIARSGVAATYASILSDLDNAIADLPGMNTQICYANAWSAKLLKASVLINRGAAGDYAQVISLTDDIIHNGPFELEGNVKDIFLSKGFSSKEVMLSVQPFPNQDYKFQYNQYNLQYIATDILKAYLENDPRANWVYQDVNSPFLGEAPELTKYYSGDPLHVKQAALNENCYAFRLTEAYLLNAEAIALSNGDLDQAKTNLKTVMQHAGLTDVSAVNAAATAADVQVLVVKEEMKNFVTENGADWFALRRLPFATIQQLQPLIQSQHQLILPIPHTEITTNILMVQNPGYSD